MARREKLYKYKINGGISMEGKRPVGPTSNLILKDGGVFKRHGHKMLLKIRDTSLAPMRINGIFDYSYVKNGRAVLAKIVHARDALFEADRDFKELRRLSLEPGILIKDQKSSAFLFGGKLFIIGCGDILVYDGGVVRRAYKHDLAYVPTTRVGVCDSLHGFKFNEGESENLLTPRRKNTFVGTSIKRTQNRASTFLLEGDIDLTKKTVLEVQIRTRTSETEPNEITTDYIGIDSEGNEVSTIVTLRYERDFLNEGGHYFMLEPPKNSRGEEIKIKIGERVYEGIEVPFGVSVSGNEITLGFEVTSPFSGGDNISFEYETKTDTGGLLKNAEIAALASGYSGAEIMLLSFGGADAYYTDEKKGFFYLPRKNKISLGTEGEKITSFVGLWDGLFGVFKENSFYKIRLTKDSYEVYSSSDVVGAYSPYSTTRLDTDCLAFGKRGIFGLNDYKSDENQVGTLSERSRKISELFNSYTEEERKNAHALFFGGTYYLFIGDDVFLTDLEKRGGSEYVFTRWTGCGGRVAYADGEGIYFGTENGEIRRFFDGYYDLYSSELSRDQLSLIVNNEGESTLLLIDEGEATLLGEMEIPLVAELGAHMRRLTGTAYKNGNALCLENGLFKDGALDVFEGETISVFLENGTEIYNGEIISLDPVSKTVEIEDPFALSEGAKYTVYKHVDLCEYELLKKDGGYLLMRGGKSAKISDISALVLKSRRPILCELCTETLCLREPNERANIVGAYLHVSDDSCGEVSVELQTRGAALKKKINIGSPVNFDRLDFEGLSFDFPFDKIVPILLFARNPDCLSLKIASKTDAPFSISEITLIRR